MAARRRGVIAAPDILLVGAGTTGLTLALIAHDHGAPVLLGRKRLLEEGLAAMSRLHASYRDSPISVEGSRILPGSPQGDDQLPDREACVDGERRRLHEAVARPGVTLPLQRDAALPAGIDLGPLVAIHRLDDTVGKELIALRTDGHIGFRCGTVHEEQLRRWLSLAGALG